MTIAYAVVQLLTVAYAVVQLLTVAYAVVQLLTGRTMGRGTTTKGETLFGLPALAHFRWGISFRSFRPSSPCMMFCRMVGAFRSLTGIGAQLSWGLLGDGCRARNRRALRVGRKGIELHQRPPGEMGAPGWGSGHQWSW